MTIANDIIRGIEPDYDAYLRQGHSLDDIDEYGFTPLIESIITHQPRITAELIRRSVSINKPDVIGRTALHWAADQNELSLCQLLLKHGADPNAFDRNGLSILVYPVLRDQNELKHLLYQHGANLEFALDFIGAKLMGHRFELKGYADIVNAAGEFIELDYEGFILEFTVAVVKDSLRRFTRSYSIRHLRDQFPILHRIQDGFTVADELLSLQHQAELTSEHWTRIDELIKAPLLILPAASRGHAMCFVRCGEWWAKIDRGENSHVEGSVVIYRITKPSALTARFMQAFLYKKQPRRYFHQTINQQLGLQPAYRLPVSSQITGNCSWANVQAVIPAAYALLQLQAGLAFDPKAPMALFTTWLDWDQDRALDDMIQRFYIGSTLRRASIAGMLAAVLFQACDASNPRHLARAEKILTIVALPDYYYILQSYLTHYCVKRLTRRGNNLLKLLDDCGINPGIDVTPIATGLTNKQTNDQRE